MKMTRLSKPFLAGLLAVSIGGCANHPVDCAIDFVPHDDCLPGTAGYESAQKRIQQTAAAVQINQQEDDFTCKSYGLTFGTSDYASCRQNLLSLRVNAGIAQQNRQAQTSAAIISNMQPVNASAAHPYVMPTTNSVTTNCSKLGDTVSCQTH